MSTDEARVERQSGIVVHHEPCGERERTDIAKGCSTRIASSPCSEQHAGGGDIWTVASADIAVLAVITMAVDRVDRCKIVEVAGKTWVAGKLLTTLTGREKVADHAVFALLLKLVA